MLKKLTRQALKMAIKKATKKPATASKKKKRLFVQVILVLLKDL